MDLGADVIIVGAGIAGASLAAELAGRARVVLVEREERPGYHATGRSAAMFFDTYGNAAIRALSRASRPFLDGPPPGFCDGPLLHARDCVFIADADRLDRLDALAASLADAPAISPCPAGEVLARVPILAEGAVAGALIDRSGSDIDVDALFQGYLRQARRGGVRLVTEAGEVRPERTADGWRVAMAAGVVTAPVLVNAAGAWADSLALVAGARPLGITPLRRTAVILPAPAGQDIRRWPMVIDVEERFYFKPDAGQILLSPANEDPMDPCDAQADELDVAIAVDRFEAATTAPVRRVTHRWAGLRSFAPDRTPVVGLDADLPGFFWLAGQGGYGIQTSPAMARVAAALLMGDAFPDNVAAEGVTAADLSPHRIRM
ncbi:MAG: hypothetical protein RLY86_3154 [Pseudomonadota bacterium]